MAGAKIDTILVTGGAGFVGSHIVETLCNNGLKVKVLDNLSFGYRNFVDKRAEFIQGSLEDENLLDKALFCVDAVIHLAASSIIKFSYKRPLEYFQNNIISGVKLLEGMRRQGVRKIINSSSAAVYGEPSSIPIKETYPKKPINAYGASKLGFEYALWSYYYAYGINSISLRYFNAYGPRDEQKPATRAIPVWIKLLLDNKSIPLYWKGEQLRDYVYVEDIVRAHIKVLNLDGIHVFNIGSGNGIVMNDIISKLEKISGKKIKTENKGARKGDPHRLVADISRIKQKIGWQPLVSLEEGLKKTYQYYEKVYQSNIQN